MKKKFTTRDLILCALFTALSAIGAFIRIPVPLVPFTLQITFTTLAGLLLGSKKGEKNVGYNFLWDFFENLWLHKADVSAMC